MRLLVVSALMVWQEGCYGQCIDREPKPYPDLEMYRSATTGAQNAPDYLAHPQTTEDLHKKAIF